MHDALFRQNGVIQCADLDEWIEAIEIFRYARPPASRGIGLIGVSGGENALVLDHAAELGLSVPPLSEAGRRRLGEFLPWFARLENPIDPTGAAIQDPSLYRKCLEVLADEPHIGIIAVSQDCPAAFDLIAAKATAEVARKSGKCFVYFNNFSGPFRTEVQAVLREAGVPYLQGLRESLKAIKALIGYHLDAPPATPALPPIDAGRRATATAILATCGPVVTEDKAKQLIAGYGLPVVAEELVHSATEAGHAAARLGYPVVAKVVSPDIAHKAQIGGVRLGLRSAAEAEEAFASIMASIAARQPSARIDGVLVQPMIGGGIETIMGLKRDPQFGMTILFGLGGVLVEALRQVSLRLVPIGEADAREMIEDVPVLKAILEKQGGAKDAIATLVRLLAAPVRARRGAGRRDRGARSQPGDPGARVGAGNRGRCPHRAPQAGGLTHGVRRRAFACEPRSPPPAPRSASRPCRRSIARRAATRSAPSRTSRSPSPAASSCRWWGRAAAARARCSRSWPD